MSEERIEYHGRIKGMPGELIRQIPAVLKCRSCSAVILRSKKDYKRKHMSVDIVTKIPPTFMHEGAVMCLICDACGSKTLLQVQPK